MANSQNIHIFVAYGGMVDAPVLQTGILLDVWVRLPLRSQEHGEAYASLFISDLQLVHLRLIQV